MVSSGYTCVVGRRRVGRAGANLSEHHDLPPVGSCKGAFQILRTADGGKTWQFACGSIDQGTGPVVCPTTTICYAGQHQTVYRSTDAGATWKSWSTVPGNTSGFIGGLVRPRAGSCIVALDVCLDCGDDVVHMQSGSNAKSQDWVDLFATRDDVKTWRHAARGGRGDAAALVCGSATRCYAPGTPDVFQTANGGRTWSSFPLSFTGIGTEVTCPGASWQKQVMEGNQAFPRDMTSIACPAVDACYAVGREDILTTHPPK